MCLDASLDSRVAHLFCLFAPQDCILMKGEGALGRTSPSLVFWRFGSTWKSKHERESWTTKVDELAQLKLEGR